MILDEFSYILRPAWTNDIANDVRELLTLNGREKTWGHALAVARENRLIARRVGLDGERAYIAGILHDISAVIRREDMLAYACIHAMPVCAAEEKYPFLLHQRLSRIIAEECFDIAETEILSPIGCHTTLKKGATSYDMALFLADKLAWDQQGDPPYERALRERMERSLEEACLYYMRDQMDSGRLLYPHTDWSEAVSWLSEVTFAR